MAVLWLPACADVTPPAPPPVALPEPAATTDVAPEPAPTASPDGGDPLVGLDGMLLPRKVDPLDAMADPLAGPFASPDDYLKNRNDEPGDGCAANKGKPSVQTKSLVGRNDVEELMLFRARTGDSCVPTEHCFIAIRTAPGWWVGERQCVGPIDALRTMSTSDTTLRWAELGPPGPMALIEYTVTVREAKTNEVVEELRWMRLCGLGPSKKATCTRPALTGCREDDGTRTASTIKIRPGGVTLSSASIPGEACGGHEAFILGDFDIVFP